MKSSTWTIRLNFLLVFVGITYIFFEFLTLNQKKPLAASVLDKDKF